MVSLIGVIVSHVIVLFDFIEEMHAKGEPFEDSLLDAGIIRLRPVLITVLATVLALFPLAMHGGPLWEPLCHAQIGGLLFATVITLILVPVIYSIAVLDLKVIKWETKESNHDACCLPPAACRIVPRASCLRSCSGDHRRNLVHRRQFLQGHDHPVGQRIRGKVTWVKTDGAVDAKNSDPSLRTRPIMGIDILTGCTGDATSAKLPHLRAQAGSSYDAELNLDKDGTPQGEGKGRDWRQDADLDPRIVARRHARHGRTYIAALSP
jgi:hypothetical protein